MKSNILASFEYNGKTYVYYIESNNKEVKYGYLDNNNIIEITDSKDIQMMNELGSKVFISSDMKDHIKLGTTTYHGKLFQEMYDKKSDLKFFYEIKDGKYYTPSNEDAMNLFKMFNEHDMFLTNKQYDRVFADTEEVRKKKNNKSVLKGILFYGAVLFIGLELHSCLVRYSGDQQQTVQSYETSVTVEPSATPASTAKIEYTEEDLIAAIDSNQNLSLEEKQLYKDQFEFVMKYAEYTDFEFLIDKLKNATINYDAKKDPYSAARYYSPYNIYDYGATGFKNTNISDLGHEVGHQCGADHPGMGWGVYEATTEIVDSEHKYAPDITTYYDIVGFQKVMYEIIGADPFGQYQQGGDITNIVKPLMKIINDETYAYQLISELDNLITYAKIANDPYNEYTDEESEEAKVNYEKTKPIIVDMLSKYFYLAKGYPMEEDLISMMYLKKYGTINDDFYFHIGGEIDTNEVIELFSIKKGYFLRKYIEENKECKIVIFSKNYGIFDFTINDSNRRIKKENNKYVLNIGEEEISASNKKSYFLGCGLSTAVKELKEYENSMAMGKPASIEHIEQVTYLKILYELIGSDPIEKYSESGDINVIIKALSKAIHLEGGANEYLIEFIQNIDMTLSFYDYCNNAGENFQSINQNYLEMANIRDSIKYGLYAMFYMAEMPDIEKNIIINLYFKQLMQTNFSDDKNNLGDLLISTNNGNTYEVSVESGTKIEIEKAYIDPKYMDQHPDTTAKIFVSESSEPITISINDDNKIMQLNIKEDNTTQYCFDEGMSKER